MGENGKTKIKVMLADDNRTFCAELKEFLDLHDEIEVCGVVNNGEQVLEQLNVLKPDILVLDVVMPKVDGFGVLEAIVDRPEYDQLDVVVLSGMSQEDIMHKCIELGAKYYMMKPIDFQVLANRLLSLKSAPIKSTTGFLPTVRNLDIEVTRVIQQMGVPAHVKGYQ